MTAPNRSCSTCAWWKKLHYPEIFEYRGTTKLADPNLGLCGAVQNRGAFSHVSLDKMGDELSEVLTIAPLHRIAVSGDFGCLNYLSVDTIAQQYLLASHAMGDFQKETSAEYKDETWDFATKFKRFCARKHNEALDREKP